MHLARIRSAIFIDPLNKELAGFLFDPLRGHNLGKVIPADRLLLL